MPDSLWSKEPPTREGWYWWRNTESRGVIEVGDGLRVQGSNWPVESFGGGTGEWCPVPTPEKMVRIAGTLYELGRLDGRSEIATGMGHARDLSARVRAALEHTVTEQYRGYIIEQRYKPYGKNPALWTYTDEGTDDGVSGTAYSMEQAKAYIDEELDDA